MTPSCYPEFRVAKWIGVYIVKAHRGCKVDRFSCCLGRFSVCGFGVAVETEV